MGVAGVERSSPPATYHLAKHLQAIHANRWAFSTIQRLPLHAGVEPRAAGWGWLGSNEVRPQLRTIWQSTYRQFMRTGGRSQPFNACRCTLGSSHARLGGGGWGRTSSPPATYHLAKHLQAIHANRWAFSTIQRLPLHAGVEPRAAGWGWPGSNEVRPQLRTIWQSTYRQFMRTGGRSQPFNACRCTLGSSHARPQPPFDETSCTTFTSRSHTLRDRVVPGMYWPLRLPQFARVHRPT